MPRLTVSPHTFPLLFLALSAIGCGESAVERPPTYPVSGTVMYNGAPVEGATVNFMGEGANRAGTGVTDAQGGFKLSTYGANDGAVAGSHKITVTKADPNAAPSGSMADEAGDDPLALGAMMEAAAADEDGKKPLIPLKYADSGSTPLSETVSDTEENIFVLQLTD